MSSVVEAPVQTKPSVRYRQRTVPAGTSPKRAAADPSTLDIGAILQRRWPLVLGSVVGGWILAAIYFVAVAPTFESNAQLLVMRKDPKLASHGVGGARDAEAISEDLLATNMQVIQGRKIIDQALALNGLDELESITAVLDEDETPTDYVLDNLNVTRGGEGQAIDAHVLNIAFQHSDPEEAKQILEAVIAQYQAFQKEKFQDVNVEAADLIVQARGELSEDLIAAENTYKEYRENAPLLWNGDESTNVHRDRYDQLQSEISLLSIQLNEAEARLEVVQKVVEQQNRDGASDLERLVVIDEKNAERVGILLAVQKGEVETAEFQSMQPERMENARSEYQSLLSLKMKQNELLQEFGPKHPAVEAIRDQIALAEQFLGNKDNALGIAGTDSSLDPADLQAAYVKLLARDRDTLVQRMAELQLLASKEEELAKTLVKYELEGETLRDLVDRKQKVYDEVVDRLREINLAKDYGGVINEVIASAETGLEVWPNLPICLALGTMLGIVCGGGGALFAESRDRSFTTPDDVKDSLGMALLAQVPAIDYEHEQQAIAASQESGSVIDASLGALHVPRSRQAEVYRGLRTSLFFRAKEDDIKTLMVTSPHQGDGKTTVLANLAVSIAQSGRSVLLVDADMRRPRVEKVLGLKKAAGLSQIVGSNEEPWDLIQETEVPKLYALPCGEAPESPAELLSSDRFREFIAHARERYDFVLVDCPPVLAVSDPCIVAPVTDAAMLVLQMSKDSRPQAVHAKEMLDEAGAEMLGAVVNRCDPRRSSTVGSYAYRYEKSYGQS
ncbi:MAG: polysaccharide biosynthesis tyrosine autokinase [Lacipirellulaceae bacterium]